MASLLGMIAAGFAFAGASKAVNKLFPEDTKDYAEETKRHNMAMEEYTRDRDSHNKEISELAYQQRQRDRNQSAAEMEHGKSVQSIKVYKKESVPLKPKMPPLLADYLKKYNVHDVSSDKSNNSTFIALGIGSVLVASMYLYGEHRRNRNG